MPKLRPVLVFAAFLAVPACVKSSPPVPDAGSVATPTAASSAPSTTSAVAPPAPAPAAPPSGALPAATTLADRLAEEARSRPLIHPNADEVLAAFAAAGGEVTTKRQGLAATYKASFCEGGTTGDRLVTLSICEYPDGDAAKVGLRTLQEVYPAKNATHVLHKDTVLTTLRLQDGPPAHTLESKLLVAYRGL